MRPTVGITAAIETVSYGSWKSVEAALSPMGYVGSVRRGGGRAVILTPDGQDARSAGEVLDFIDALILTGGAGDLDPALYDRERHPMTGPIQPGRDAYELALVREAGERGVPTLGICRGMQVINVAYGGTLEQHLPDAVGHEKHRSTPGVFSDHEVRLTADSAASRSVGREIERVKSHHHQGVREVGGGLSATGWATLDDTVEAIEDSAQKFMLGVLWHPEEDEKSRLISALIQEVG